LYKKGVLHRDASASNIIINISSDSEPSKTRTYGYLIDYDHAKPAQSFKKWPNPASSSPSDIAKLIERVKYLAWPVMEVTDEAATMALAINSDPLAAFIYLDTMLKRRKLGSPDGNKVSERTLGWKRVSFLCFIAERWLILRKVDRQPLFNDHVPGPGIRTVRFNHF
jgi:hypothetical protein